MLTLSCLCGGLALLSWPAPSAGRRLATLAGSGGRSFSSVFRGRYPARHGTSVAAAVAAVLAVVLFGPAMPVAVALLAGAVAWHWRSRARTRANLAAARSVAEAIRALAGELRAGAHPSAAAESAAADADTRTASALRAIAASARLGGELVPAVVSAPSSAARSSDLLAQLLPAWSLAHQHGLPLATVLDAVQHDVDAKVRLATQIDARMAGPRASAGILALLPAGGIALGEAMGAGPLGVLGTTPIGQLLLVLGSALVLAGVLWSATVTGRVTAC